MKHYSTFQFVRPLFDYCSQLRKTEPKNLYKSTNYSDPTPGQHPKNPTNRPGTIAYSHFLQRT